MNPGSGTLIAFATSEGSTASDGTGVNGLFTEKLVKNIKKPAPIETIFKYTRMDVQNASGGNQSPQEWTKLTGDFYFVKGAGNVTNNAADNDISITEEALPPGSIKLTSYLSGTLYIDGQSKGTMANGKVYTLNNIPVGSHKLQIGEWEQDVEVSSNQTAQVNAKSTKAKDLPNQLFDSRDNKYYKIVEIGSQVWMAENLAFNAGSNCWAYDGNQSNVTKYGYIYNWETAKNVCPSGWRLPSKSDFETLLNNVGGSGGSAYQALIPSGSSGFSAPFGGSRGSNGSFDTIGKYAFFWSSSPINDEFAWHLFIISFNSKANVSYYSKSFGFSVRCLQDN
jgi:uncharacterized protein (TIGR02145 family)